MKSNYDSRTVDGFGDEWSKFNFSDVDENEMRITFNRYFKIFPWELLSKDAVGFDMGCGSGRHAKLVAPRVGKLYCVDASKKALEVSKKNLAELKNCEFIESSVDDLPWMDNSMDFCYSLGVLHHVPDTEEGIKACVNKLRKGAPCLLYLYYSFENRPHWFYLLWKITDYFRFAISRMPFSLRFPISQVIALLIYYPLARISLLVERMGFKVEKIPLSAYRARSFYFMRTDALDRFGTRLEKRFSKKQIRDMMENAGLEKIQFSDTGPYWCVVGLKK